ncbi:BatD family protein [Primorskyibacter flagellatus]|uniref:Oxygen tolerance n=1 Tax=Primorskyibacter flagellatus TaxID=1387277 RepID=A0A1W2A4C3_9RHOB|nr:BatD family protein [Primorskyibacter flagellatus]SMC55525.1 Oxygen tolerance [Primorskyibacter flagellatus]
MRMVCLLITMLFAGPVLAQSRNVEPQDLQLTVTVLEQDAQPYAREMIPILIRGVYRRHITLEKLEQPALEGFNWTQLGPDKWSEERLNGKTVKVMERRMALYPEDAGTLTIGPFTHHLTLTDEGDDWFAHDITSPPVTVEVAAPPDLPEGGWWFPAKRVEISDQWSNAPDRLKAGEGVLRIVRIKAIGVTPEMVPPMPELHSPSGMVFAHPEKRLIELSPEGPVTFVFWRWTIRPGNAYSTIVEPLHLEYFDTDARVMRDVTISAQRVAYDETALPPVPPPARPSVLPGWPVAFVALLIFGAGLGWMVSGRRPDATALRRRLKILDPLTRQMARAARAGEPAQVRRAAYALVGRDGAGPEDGRLLDGLDRAIFAPDANTPDLRGFVRSFLQSHARVKTKR